jgi:heme oxygenase
MSHAAAAPPPDPTLHAALRAATAALHDAVEARFAGFDLSRRGPYGDFLRGQAAGILPVEAALDAAGIARILPDWPRRARTAALLADLAALGREPPAVPPPRFAPGGEALGAAYVLEGSRLGAALLLRQVGPGLPDAFLRHGAHGGLWRSFLARLAPAPDRAAVIRGARQAFGHFLTEVAG